MKRQRRKFFLKNDPNINSLPWCFNEVTFYDQCTRCLSCVNACETNIIKLNKFGFPIVDFSRGECTFCYACADACDVPLLFIKKNERPWNKVVKIHSTCLSLHNTECRSCADCCEERAIKFVPHIGGYQIMLEQEKCTGCGACIRHCPVKAIELASFPHFSADDPNVNDLNINDLNVEEHNNGI